MPDYRPYGVTQNPDAEAVTANQLVGSPAGSATAHEINPDFEVSRYSTAPYIPPRQVSKRGKCVGNNDTCNAYPVRGTDFCIFHQPREPGESSATP